jgi:hypothetical protein
MINHHTTTTPRWVFGGYSTLTLGSSSGAIQDDGAFLFRLRADHDTPAPMVLRANPDDTDSHYVVRIFASIFV